MYISRKKKRFKNLTLCLREVKEEQQTKPKVNRRKEIKMRAEINEKNREMLTKKKSCFFKMINKINKSLARLTKKKKEDLKL